jgi:hypothetical protein
VRDLSLSEPGSIVFERQLVLGFVDAESPQSVSVGEGAQVLKLFGVQAILQLVCNFDECHARSIPARSSEVLLQLDQTQLGDPVSRLSSI